MRRAGVVAVGPFASTFGPFARWMAEDAPTAPTAPAGPAERFELCISNAGPWVKCAALEKQLAEAGVPFKSVSKPNAKSFAFVRFEDAAALDAALVSVRALRNKDGKQYAANLASAKHTEREARRASKPSKKRAWLPRTRTRLRCLPVWCVCLLPGSEVPGGRSWPPSRGDLSYPISHVARAACPVPCLRTCVRVSLCRRSRAGDAARGLGVRGVRQRELGLPGRVLPAGLRRGEGRRARPTEADKGCGGGP